MNLSVMWFMNNRFIGLFFLQLLLTIRCFAGQVMDFSDLTSYLNNDCTSDIPYFLLKNTNKPDEFQQKSDFNPLASAVTKEARAFAKDLLSFDNATDQALFNEYVERNIVYDNLQEVGKSNKGLVIQAKSLLSNNSCFSALTKAFYDDIEENKNKDTEVRALISDSTEKGSHSEVRNQWVWKKALKFANNNSNLALAIIGICGHDDNFQDGSNPNVGKPKTMGKIDFSADKVLSQPIQKAIEKCNKKISDIREQETSDWEKTELIPTLKDLHAGKLVPTLRLTCPDKKSDFFVPGSLPVDIPNDLKNRILKSQSTDIVFKNIEPPAKYYHIIGSASIVCDLIQRGMSKSNAKSLETLFSIFYRTARICTSRKVDEKFFATVEEEFAKYSSNSKIIEKLKSKEDNSKFIVQFRTALNQLGIPLDVLTEPTVMDEKLNALRAYLVASKIYRERQPGASSDRLKSEMTQEFGKYGKSVYDQIDAKKGFNAFDWIQEKGADAAGVSVPEKACILNNIQMQSNPNVNDQCPEAVSDEICKMAKKKIESWDIDVEWTKKAHLAGAQFATEQCKEAAAPYSNEISCVALKKLIQQPNELTDSQQPNGVK